MIHQLLLSPIPMVLAVLLFSALSWPRIGTRLWARVGRLLAVAVFLANIGTLYSATNDKVREGRRRAEELRNTTTVNQAVQVATPKVASPGRWRSARGLGKGATIASTFGLVSRHRGASRTKRPTWNIVRSHSRDGTACLPRWKFDASGSACRRDEVPGTCVTVHWSAGICPADSRDAVRQRRRSRRSAAGCIHLVCLISFTRGRLSG